MGSKTRIESPTPQIPASTAWPRCGVFVVALMAALLISIGWSAALLPYVIPAADPRIVYSQWSLVYGVDHLWGWAGLALFGLLVWWVRQRNARRLPAFWAAIGQLAFVLGFLGRVVAIMVSSMAARGQIHVAAAVCLVIAAILLVLDLLRYLSGRGLDAGDLFLLAAAQWLLIWAGADVVIRYHTRMHGEPSEGLWILLMQLPLLAFAGNLILGAGIKLLPTLLQITRLRQRACVLSLLAYNLGLVLLFGPPAIGAWGYYLVPAGTLLLFGGALLYLAGLNFLAGAIRGFGTKPFIRLAFVWLGLGLSLMLARQIVLLIADPLTMRPPADPYVSAYRHLLAVGFVATFVIALGQRLLASRLPLALQTPRLAIVSLWLLTLGLLWRVTFELLTLADFPLGYRLLGIGGIFELLSVLLFGIAILRAWRVGGLKTSA